MPLHYLHGRWHFYQRMNKKVWTNIERLKLVSAEAQSKQDILDALHPWRLAISLRFNNTFAILQLGIAIICLVISMLWFSTAPWLFTVIWLAAIGLAIYSYFSIEHRSDVEQIIQQLTEQVFQYQYEVKFYQFPHIDKNMLNPTYMLSRVRQSFDCLNQGNAGNKISRFAATSWRVEEHDFPVLLFHYECINETATRDSKGNIVKKQLKSDFYGACVFNLPPLAFMVSNIESRYPRYPVRWSSSDIQFNKNFKLAGQQELELARNLTPQRILALANHLTHMRGTLMFHDQMNAFCYISSQNIFAAQAPNKKINDISMLRGYLRTLKAPHYEKMQQNLTAIIKQFKDDQLLHDVKEEA